MLVTALALGATACTEVERGGAAKASKPKKDATTAAQELVTPEMVVDLTFAKAGAKAEFCKAYRLLGDAGFAAFKQGYTENQPSPRAVFNEAASRC